MKTVRAMLGTAGLFVLACAPAMAASTMSQGGMGGGASGIKHGSMSMMKGGEVIALMPDGHMGTATMTRAKTTSTVGMSSAVDHCVMFIRGSSGKLHQVDTSSAAAQKECEGIAK